MWISFSREGQIFQSTVWESSASCSSVLPQWLLNSERHVFWQCCGILGTTSKERKKIRKLNWVEIWMLLGSVQFSSVTQSCPTLCDPMDCSMQGLPIHHQLQKFTQTHGYWVSDAIQQSHPLLSPSPPAFNLSQHQGLFQWFSSLHQVTKVLQFQLQHQSLQWILRTDFL